MLHRALSLLVLMLAYVACPPAGAQQPPVVERQVAPEELETMVRQAASEGARILVIERPALAPPSAADELALLDAVEMAERRLATISREAGADVAALSARVHVHWPSGWSGFAQAAVLALVACTAAWGLEILFRRLLRRRASPEIAPAPVVGRYSSLVRAAAADLMALGFQIMSAVAIFLAMTERGAPDRDVGYAIILIGCVSLRLGLYLLDLFDRQARPVRSADGEHADGIATVRRRGIVLVGVLAVVSAVIVAIDRLDLGAGLRDLTRLAVAAGFVIALGAVLWNTRRAISAVMLGTARSPVARIWPWLAIAYLAGALALFAARVLTGEPVNGMAILAPIYCGAIAMIAYALCMASLLERRNPDPELGAPTPLADSAVEARQVPPEPAAPAPGDPHAVSMALALAVWVGGIAFAWGVPFWSNDAEGVHGFWAVLLILVIARIGWIAIRAYFDARLAEEGPVAATGEPGDEGGGKGSRLGTILPLFRSFLLITVGVIAAMVVLSQLGIDIGPLFAGAGLVGLAVGFGAQSLVRDIFSGLFFLVDDAFRVGEYIETGGLRGTVERISIRSMQLRHQNGPLHTIPFGEVTQLTNFSRDWVIMKLPIRVTFDTDPERVRKLIKKLGQDMQADPLIGDKFVEPLKSQGVREIDDSGQVIRVKFMTRPGDQFVLRKTVYARIRELFEREGIEFAAREVRVRVTTQGEPLSEAETDAVAASAAESVLDR